MGTLLKHGKEKILKGGPLRALLEPVLRSGGKEGSLSYTSAPTRDVLLRIQRRSLSPFLALLLPCYWLPEVCTVQGLLQQRIFPRTHLESSTFKCQLLPENHIPTAFQSAHAYMSTSINK